MNPRQIGAIILAAGASSRLGRPKQLATLDGETLLDRAVRTARQAGCSPVFVVLGAGAQEILAHSHLEGATSVSNPLWEEGMASSIRLGVEALQHAAAGLAGSIVMVCDQPAVTVDHLVALSATTEITASAYGDSKGTPAFFPAADLRQLLTLKGDTGARALLQNASAIPLGCGELDIDTEADLSEAQRLLCDQPRSAETS